jgi:hypothetical protein
VGRRPSAAQLAAALRRGGRQRGVEARAKEILQALRTEQLNPPEELSGAYGVVVSSAAMVLVESASTLPRMRDSAEVVGAAWRAKVDGAGCRSIAAKLGRPEPTVRRWPRRLASRAGALRAAATDWLYQFDPSAPPLEPAGSPLADALESVGRAVASASSRLGPRPPWPTAATLTGGLVASWGGLPPACLPPWVAVL